MKKTYTFVLLTEHRALVGYNLPGTLKPDITTIYLRKSALPTPLPKTLTVTIEIDPVNPEVLA